jgi:hypothetical protein
LLLARASTRGLQTRLNRVGPESDWHRWEIGGW